MSNDTNNFSLSFIRSNNILLITKMDDLVPSNISVLAQPCYELVPYNIFVHFSFSDSCLCPWQYKVSLQLYTLSSLYNDEVNVVPQHLTCLQISSLEQHNETDRANSSSMFILACFCMKVLWSWLFTYLDYVCSLNRSLSCHLTFFPSKLRISSKVTFRWMPTLEWLTLHQHNS
jgi:hypothetical protein